MSDFNNAMVDVLDAMTDKMRNEQAESFEASVNALGEPPAWIVETFLSRLPIEDHEALSADLLPLASIVEADFNENPEAHPEFVSKAPDERQGWCWDGKVWTYDESLAQAPAYDDPEADPEYCYHDDDAFHADDVDVD